MLFKMQPLLCLRLIFWAVEAPLSSTWNRNKYAFWTGFSQIQ